MITSGKKVRNMAVKPAINESQARAIADNQIVMGELKTESRQLMLRISKAIFSGLRNGGPPTTVGP